MRTSKLNQERTTRLASLVLSLLMLCSFAACKAQPASLAKLQAAITNGDTSPNNATRVLLVDVRASKDFIAGHIQDALSAPLTMFAEGGEPLYTNSFDEVSTTAETGIANSWLAHMLINQLVNDFTTTYETSQIIFYGATIADGIKAAQVAQKAGYKNVSFLLGSYASWKTKYSGLTKKFYEGIDSVNEDNGTFIVTGYINNTNFDEISTKGTWHGITYKGGGLHDMCFFQSDAAPFYVQELLTYLGASPEGNMANGVNISAIPDEIHNNGQQVAYSVSWDGAGQYYPIADVYAELPSLYQPDPHAFEPLGIESRIGGTRESNINWNSGCIFCLYSCTVGITSNAKTNQATWYADGGIYDGTDDPKNNFAGRFFPRTDLLPGAGTPVKFKIHIVQ